MWNTTRSKEVDISAEAVCQRIILQNDELFSWDSRGVQRKDELARLSGGLTSRGIYRQLLQETETMEAQNPVTQFIVQGMKAEVEGRPDAAADLFLQAWDVAVDDYDACIAAHYVARHQKTPNDTLHWNQVCLDRADKVGDERVRGFYPSLHLNLARAHVDLGDREAARDHFRRAAERIHDAAAGPYGEGIRFAVAKGLRATGDLTDSSDALTNLINRLCARADLPSLALLLPPYLGNLGGAADRTRLLTALQMVHASRALEGEDLSLLRQAIGELNGV
jgi:hypothetical protein